MNPRPQIKIKKGQDGTAHFYRMQAPQTPSPEGRNRVRKTKKVEETYAFR
ncbi:hypothetical protein COXBURSA331_A1942 [Coxiella burnetii RSA 331]|nr:hypothetical protein COXBURSA331_A1942 [Coxiella burnetii RSA 331]